MVKFFATYFLLFGLYSLYLHKTQQKGDVFVCSPITRTVAEHAEKVSRMLGYDVRTEQHAYELSIKFILNDVYLSRIVEGCTAVSVIILFLAFIIAFSGRLVPTLWFGLVGSLLIYLVNIIRIIAFNVLYYKFPEYLDILHNLFFPAVIYGFTFILWITWVKNYSNLGKNASS